MDNNCSKQFLDKFIDNIDALQKYIEECGEIYNNFNLLYFYYFTVNRNFIISLLISIVILFFSFLLLQTAADQYLATVISSISKKLKFPPSIAALTLIAFSNGAPDIFNSILVNNEDESSAMALGSLLGAFLFTSTLVVSNVLANSPIGIQLKPFQIMKDLITYLIALSILTAFGFYQKINWILIVTLAVLYVVYVLVSIWKKEKFNDEENLDQKNIPDIQIIVHDDDDEEIKENKEENLKDNLLPKSVISQRNTYTQLSPTEMFTYFFWDNESPLIFRIVRLPINYVLVLTVPHYYFVTNSYTTSQKEKIIKKFSYFFGILIPLVSLFHLNIYHSLLISGVFILFIIIIDYIGVLENYEIGLNQFLCLLVTISWIQISSGFVLDCINLWSFLLNLNKIFLAMIIISGGNSIGDLFGNAALAKLGNETMALIGCFSGQVFNLLISLILNFSFTSDKSFNIFGIGQEKQLTDKFIIFLFIFSFFILISDITIIYLQYFTLTKKNILPFVLTYSLFIIGSIFILFTNQIYFNNVIRTFAEFIRAYRRCNFRERKFF